MFDVLSSSLSVTFCLNEHHLYSETFLLIVDSVSPCLLRNCCILMYATLLLNAITYLMPPLFNSVLSHVVYVLLATNPVLIVHRVNLCFIFGWSCFGHIQTSCHCKLPELGPLSLDVFCNGIRILAYYGVEANVSQCCLNTLDFPSITLLNLWQTMPIFGLMLPNSSFWQQEEEREMRTLLHRMPNMASVSKFSQLTFSTAKKNM